MCFGLLAVFIYPCMFAFPASFVALYFSPCAHGCACVSCLVAMRYVLSLCVTVTFKDQTAKDKALQHMAAMSSAQIVSATAIHNKLGLPGIPRPTFPGAPGVSHSCIQKRWPWRHGVTMGQHETDHLALVMIWSGVREPPCGELIIGAKRRKKGRKGGSQGVRERWGSGGSLSP